MSEVIPNLEIANLKINDTSNNNNYILTVSELTADRNINLPLLSDNDVFTFNNQIQTLTNKVISNSTNTIGANELRTTGSSVTIDSAAPPTTGQILQATSATTAEWNTVAGAGNVTGPVIATDTALVRFDSTSGTLLQDSGITLDASDNMSGVGFLQFNDISTPGNPLDTQGRIYKKTGNDGLFWIPDSGGLEVDLTAGAAGGESNTASNIGTGSGTIGIFKQKTTTDLEFYGLNIGSNKLSLVFNTSNGTLDYDIIESNIIIGNLSGAPSGLIVGTTDTQTLTNKTLTTPIISTISNTGTLTLPTTTDTLVGRATTDTLTNKTLTAPIISTISNTGTITLPTTTDTLVGRVTTDTLTNKTLTDATNTITANNLRSATTSISISAATAPTIGQILTATSGTAATWQTPAGGGGVTTAEFTSAVTSSTTSTSYVIIDSLLTTPAAGTYVVIFSCSCNGDQTNSQLEFAIHSNGTEIVSSHRFQNYAISNSMKTMINNVVTQAVVTVNGGEQIDVRYRTNAGTLIIYERSMIIIS